MPPSFSDLGKAARDIFSKGFSKYQNHDRMYPNARNYVSARFFDCESVIYLYIKILFALLAVVISLMPRL